MRAITIGDNAMDFYIDQGIYYPGGNPVNVAVGMKRAGVNDVAYLGVFGDDQEAEYIRQALSLEGISIDRCRKVYAKTSRPSIRLLDGNPMFVGGLLNTAQHIVRLRLMPDDIAYLKTFDLCHTSFLASIEPELPNIRKACELSFDFSSLQKKEYLTLVCPHVRFSFFSGAHMREDAINALVETVHQLGTEIVVITLGNRGATLSAGGVRYNQALIPVDAVDTLGAGDHFIAGFLSSFGKGESIPEALRFAAQCGADACSHYGGFGYGKPFCE